MLNHLFVAKCKTTITKSDQVKMSVESHLMEPPAVVNIGENYYTLKNTTSYVIFSSVFQSFNLHTYRGDPPGEGGAKGAMAPPVVGRCPT